MGQNQGVSATQGILIAVITALLTTFGNYYVSIYTKEVEHKNWIEQQEYLNLQEDRKEYEELTKQLLKLHTDLRSSELETIALTLKVNLLLLNPDYPKQVLLAEQQRIAKKLEDHLAAEKRLNSGYQMTLMNIGIFVSENLSGDVTEYLKVKVKSSSSLSEYPEKLKRKLDLGQQFNSIYRELVDESQNSYVSQGQEEAFIKLLKAIRNEQLT